MNPQNHKHMQAWLTLAVLALLAATALAYYPGLHGPFMFDDTANIVDNANLRLASLAPHELARAAFSSHSGLLYRPVSMLSFALNPYFFGDQSFSFKLTNLIIHLLNALLILWLTRRLLINCRQRYGFAWTDARIGWTSVIIAAAWALHPLNLTAVLYVVQRMTELAALFTLAGILSYVLGRERMQAGKTGWPLVWLLTPAFGLIGVFCKEDAALLPLYLLVIEWLVFGFRTARQTIAKNLLAFYLCGLVLPGILGLTYLVQHRFWAGYVYRDFTLPERLLTEFRVVFLYIQWTFIPDIRQLALYHDDLALSTGLLTPLTTLWSLLALIALIAVAWWQHQRRPLLSLGILFFFAGQAMESTVLPLEIAFEHRNYLPDYGLLLALFSLLLPAASHQLQTRVFLRWAIAALAIPVLFSVTLLRASEWRNYLDFAYYEAQHHPDSARAWYTLGQAYANLALAGGLKNPDLAFTTLAKSAAISHSIMADTAMILVSAKLKLPLKPAWQEHAEYLLRTYPVSSEDIVSLYTLVNCLPEKECKNLADTAHSLLQTAFDAKSIQSNPAVTANLWIIYSNYLTFTGSPMSAIIPTIQNAVRLEPRTPQFRISLAKAMIVTGNFVAARHEIQELSSLNMFGNLDHDIKQLNDMLSEVRAGIEKLQRTKK